MRMFNLEHPGNSFAHDLDEWKELEDNEGVSTLLHHASRAYVSSMQGKEISVYCDKHGFDARTYGSRMS